MRLFCISDIHIDFDQNRKWIDDISASDFRSDALIVAGDVSHDIDDFENVFSGLSRKFSQLFFIPGNHDLWIHNGRWEDSLSKLQHLFEFCDLMSIKTKPVRLGKSDGNPLWVVPLHSWYSQPGEGKDSLYITKPGEDPSNRMWSDNYYIKWPESKSKFKASVHFIDMNNSSLKIKYDAPIVSFSHFIPREEMMFSEDRYMDLERIKKYDRTPQFNFSRVAGSALIEEQIRKLGSKIHIYGHQHINRDREIDGVRYISHCLGYPNERKRGQVRGLEEGVKLIWDTDLD